MILLSKPDKHVVNTLRRYRCVEAEVEMVAATGGGAPLPRTVAALRAQFQAAARSPLVLSAKAKYVAQVSG